MPHYYDIREWMDKHELNICELDDREKDELMEACNEATYKHDLKEFMEEHEDDFKDEYEEYCKEEKENGEEPEEYDDWFVTYDKKEELERQFNDNRCPDDYYPLWCTAWLFPSPYSAEGLNDMGMHGLVFFEFHDEVTVSLTTIGMDMSPSLFLAYYLHSDISFQKKSILDKVLSSGLDYFKYVVGSEHLLELMEAIGKDLMVKYDKESKKRYKEFDATIKKLSEARDNGKMDQFETGMLGMMALFKTQKPMDGDKIE
jgi:hypothetical protein